MILLDPDGAAGAWANGTIDHLAARFVKGLQLASIQFIV